MTEIELDRWKQLSIGLARVAFPGITAARRKKLVDDVEEFIELLTYNYGLEKICDWDGGRELAYICDEMSQFLWNRDYEIDRRGESIIGRFGMCLSACIRAGFDVAVCPSGGVIGFTVGDLKNVFDGVLPDWVTNFFDPPLPSDAEDSEGVWL